MPEIYSLRTSAQKRDPIPPGAVVVARHTPWGNPWRIGETIHHSNGAQEIVTRERAVALYEEYARHRLRANPHWLDPLRGKDLVCWCVSPSDGCPKACHAQVLLRLLAEMDATP